MIFLIRDLGQNLYFSKGKKITSYLERLSAIRDKSKKDSGLIKSHLTKNCNQPEIWPLQVTEILLMHKFYSYLDFPSNWIKETCTNQYYFTILILQIRSMFKKFHHIILNTDKLFKEVRHIIRLFRSFNFYLKFS